MSIYLGTCQTAVSAVSGLASVAGGAIKATGEMLVSRRKDELTTGRNFKQELLLSLKPEDINYIAKKFTFSKSKEFTILDNNSLESKHQSHTESVLLLTNQDDDRNLLETGDQIKKKLIKDAEDVVSKFVQQSKELRMTDDIIINIRDLLLLNFAFILYTHLTHFPIFSISKVLA